jgi:hypothetical protein
MTARSDWEKHKNYPPMWSWATWPERAGIVLTWVVGSIFGVGMFIAALAVLGSVLDGVSRHVEEHDRCMKRATNGYEIERCR